MSYTHRPIRKSRPQPRRIRKEPTPPKPCFVENHEFSRYDFFQPDDYHRPVLNFLTNGKVIHKFPSRTAARKAIYHTIQYLESRGLKWGVHITKKDYNIVNLEAGT